MQANTLASNRARRTMVRFVLLLSIFSLVLLTSCSLFRSRPRPVDRFVPIGREAVWDTKTKLMWEVKTQENANRFMTWSEARAYCRNLELAGFTDWRLPSPGECKTLMDRSLAPAEATGIFRFPLVWCWTSKRSMLGSEAEMADFAARTISKVDQRTGLLVRAVRKHKAGLIAALDPDGDGVWTGEDMCPDTPPGVPVDNAGCPRDSDEDGVADDLDRCPNTPPRMPVEPNGCPSREIGRMAPAQERTVSPAK